MIQDTSFIFFGTDEFSVVVLEELKKAGYTPALVVTVPDRKQGRGMKLTPSPIKVFAEKNNIPVLQPEKLDKNFVSQMLNVKCQMFVVASYGKVLPKEILDIPKHGTLNVHPSLLPFFRGPSPIHSQILENTRIVGATIMLMDEKVDHGPIAAQEILQFPISNFQFPKVRHALAHLGGKLLARTIPEWIQGNIEPQEQDHKAATYTEQITKEDGLVDIGKENPEMLYRKFRAYHTWPGIYFFQNGKRIKITDAELRSDLEEPRFGRDGKRSDLVFVIKKVIPEGKKGMNYTDFKKEK